VTFLGNLDRSDVLPRLYASADAFLFASLTETLGLVVLEAMSSGLPVIAVPAGGVADHLRDGFNGIACAAGDVSDWTGHERDALAPAREQQPKPWTGRSNSTPSIAPTAMSWATTRRSHRDSRSRPQPDDHSRGADHQPSD
jgi:hypothetical protein